MDSATIDQLVQKWAAHWSAQLAVPVDAGLVRAIIRVESSDNPNAIANEPNGHKSYGLMQLLDTTAAGLGFTGDPRGLLVPDVNISLGVRYLAQLVQRYGDQGTAAVVSAYNGGRPLHSGDGFVNQVYVARVLAAFSQFGSRVVKAVEASPGGGLPFLLAAALLLVYLTSRRRGRRLR